MPVPPEDRRLSPSACPTCRPRKAGSRVNRVPIPRSPFALAAAGAAAVLPPGAWGPASSWSGSSGGGESQVTALCSLTSPPTSSATPPPTAAPSPVANASGMVGVILPDTTSSTRYTLYDAPLLQKAFDAAGIKSDVQNAQGSTVNFQQIAQSMIGEGVKVLIIDSIDQTSGAAVEQEAAAAGIQVIDYDRVNLGGQAAYYVSFDNLEVGVLQGQALVDCFTQSGVSNPKIIMEDGGTDVDNNAVLFAQGAKSVLQPLQQQGKLTVESEVVDKGWDIANAAPVFSQALTAAGGSVDGVVAANDDIANAVIGVLQQNGLVGHVQVTGQDAQVEGLQNILKGQQSMTIFKNITYEADAAAKLAIALTSGQSPSSLGLTFSSQQIDPNNPGLQSVLLPPQVITYSNVEDVIAAGALTAAQVCSGLETQCAQAGIH